MMQPLMVLRAWEAFLRSKESNGPSNLTQVYFD